jgi:hypothetical protein
MAGRDKISDTAFAGTAVHIKKKFRHSGKDYQQKKLKQSKEAVSICTIL